MYIYVNLRMSPGCIHTCTDALAITHTCEHVSAHTLNLKKDITERNA